MAPAPRVVPSDPAVPRRGPQRGGGKSRRPEPTVRRTDEVADLAAREGRHPVRVLACDQRVPQSPVRRVRDGGDPEIPYPRGMRWNSFGLGDIGLEQARPAVHRRGLRRRKDDVRNPFGQGGERLHAAGKLRAPARVGERELLADPPAQGGPTVEPLLRQDEEAAQAHHPVQVRGALLVAPPHPRIARAKTQRRGGESTLYAQPPPRPAMCG